MDTKSFLRSPMEFVRTFAVAMFFFAITLFTFIGSVSAQSAETPKPNVVQPGAPGEPTRRLSNETMGVIPVITAKDIEFLRGMIVHHAQAVEMTDMIESRTENRDMRLLGERISKSQEDEMEFMKRWLEIRNQSPEVSAAHGHGSRSGSSKHSMPGMLSPAQMNELRNAKGKEFDRLFLVGMIQHHEGALVMVKDLFETAGAGQDAELFNFATDVDSGQRAEIKTMETLLTRIP